MTDISGTIEQFKRANGQVESCCDGGRMCKTTNDSGYTYPYEIDTAGGPNADGCIADKPPEESIVVIHPAEAATVAERGKSYGDPSINLTGIGLHWTAILRNHFQNLDIPVIPGHVVALMFAGAKLNRLAKSPDHEDSEHDLRCYLSLAQAVR